MPKRLRSTDDDHLASLVKNHISDREVNNGILKERNMLAVHEKTLALLYRGQKNVANNNAVNKPGVSVPSRDKQLYRQLCLTNAGLCTAENQSNIRREMACCSCVKPSCLPSGRYCQLCAGSIGLTCLLVCHSCGVSCCGGCDGVRRCGGGCGSFFCGSCATPTTASDCLCHLCCY